MRKLILELWTRQELRHAGIGVVISLFLFQAGAAQAQPGRANITCFNSCDFDDDGDGWTEAQGDCLDSTIDTNAPFIHPTQPDSCGFPGPVDSNCNYCTGDGCTRSVSPFDLIDCDADGDGISALAGDCDDADVNIHPDAAEVCDNGYDDNCNPLVDADDPDCGGGGTDDDGDGVTVEDGDCDDANPAIHPGATEVANSIDDNCNGFIDEIFEGQLFATGEEVVVTLAPSNRDGSGLASDVCLFSPGNMNCFVTVPPHPGGEPSSGESFNFGAFPLGTELLIGLRGKFSFNPNAPTRNVVLGPACRNFDNAAHGLVGKPSAGSGVLVGFEDLEGGGDGDFEDVMLTVTGVISGGPTTTVPERCNDIDDDCSGGVDDGPVDAGGNCSTGQQGVCSAGTRQCASGVLSCIPNQSSSAEVCDNLDNDCNGLVDDNLTGVGQACATGQPGVCNEGTTTCSAGAISCQPNLTSSPEACDGLDNDCDGQTDEDNVCEPPGIHDLAVTSIAAPATVTIKGGVAQMKTVTVQVQNRSGHTETIPDAATLENLVNLTISPIVMDCTAAPTIVLDPPKKFPVVLKSKGKIGVKFDVTFTEACDPDKTTKKNPGHDDFRYSATVHHSVLGGADIHPADDSCPRPALGVDPNPDGKISDVGCAEERTDVVVK